MKMLRKQISQQKKEKQALEQQINILYGGEEKGIEKEEQMNLVLLENKQLQLRLDELERDSEAIKKFERQVQGKNSKTIDEISDAQTQIVDLRAKVKALNKQSQVLREARESYFTALKHNAQLKNQAKVVVSKQILSSSSQAILSPVNKNVFKTSRHSSQIQKNSALEAYSKI